jgi:hypothetical protein
MFTFGATGEGMLTFEGWEESHLQSDLYLLKVEKVVHLKGENRTDIPVEGQCTISGDFHKNALITCNATSLEGKNPFHAVFKMTSPPKITYGDKLEPVTVSSSLGQADEEKYVDDRIIEGLTKVRDQRIPLSPTKTDIIVAFSLEALPKIIKLVSQNDMEALAFMFRAEQNGMAIKPGVKLYVEAFNVITILGRSCVAVQVRIKGNPMPLWTTMRMLDVAISKLPKDLGL